LQGTKSNRDAIGARIEVDGQTKWLEAGSGFLSQHSKQLLFGLGESGVARGVRITWPSGQRQEFSNLHAGKIYSITEGSNDIKAQWFRAQLKLPSRPVIADNTLKLEDTWFLEPIPLPERQRGPGLLVLTDHDLAKPERREQYEIFRRYLFDWRTELKLPLVLLLNADGHAVKIYANLQNAHSEPRAQASGQALPFPGFYIGQPHRDFFKFGAAFLWSGYNEQALPYLEQVLRRTPDNARVLVLVGQIHLQADRVSAAEKYFRDAMRVNPQYAEAWSGLGDVCQTENHQQEALANYEKALALKPDLFYTLLNAGQASDKLNQQPQAEAYYRRALSLDAKSPEALNGLGLALAKQGHSDEAKKLFEEAISLRRDYSGAINNLGVLYIQEGKVNDAIAAFEYGVRVAPDEDILYLNLGRTYTRMGNIEKARQVMQALLDRKPDSATARHALQELNSR
jgi:tetratricopeptide (TPR) repeat protein